MEDRQHLERLNQLATFLQLPAREFIAALRRDHALIMFVSYTWRSAATQQALFEQGRTIDRETGSWVVTQPDLVVTNAVPGSSPHNVMLGNQPASLALDMIPMTSTGHLLWGTNLTTWDKIYTYAWKFGFDPLGDSIGAQYEADRCHFEEPNWKQKVQGLGLTLPTAVSLVHV